MDSGSTVKLIKWKELVTNVKKSEKQLLMATNGGDKAINQTCMVPEFGDLGWFDELALTNIHGLCEVVRGGHHVNFDSKKYNGFW